MKMNHAGDFRKTNPNKANFQMTEDRRRKTEDGRQKQKFERRQLK